MSDTMSDMKDINTRELQKHTREVRERVAAGESLRWVMGEETVAYITPAQETKEPQPWPDLMARLKDIYGDDHRPEVTGQEIIEEGRGHH